MVECPWHETAFMLRYEKYISRYLYHAFVVFKTGHFWWSVDKNVDGVTIQRSTTFDKVSKLYRQKNRTNQKLVLVKSEAGKITVRQLLSDLCRENLFSNSFKFLTDNCKQFANSVFKLAVTEHS
jgi:hypothetical protein